MEATKNNFEAVFSTPSRDKAFEYAADRSYMIHGTYSVYFSDNRYSCVNGVRQEVGAPAPVATFLNGVKA